jgi:hypothetical protein
MAETIHQEALLRLAERYVWWTKPDMVVARGLPRLVVSVMELGTWEDAHELLDIVGPQMFIDVLKAPPPGIISAKSLAFWLNPCGPIWAHSVALLCRRPTAAHNKHGCSRIKARYFVSLAGPRLGLLRFRGMELRLIIEPPVSTATGNLFAGARPHRPH